MDERFSLDDFGLADRFVKRFSDRIRFYQSCLTDAGSWMICESGTWRKCSVAEPKRLAQQMIRALPDEEADSYSDVRSSPRKPSPRELFLKWCAKNMSRGGGASTAAVLLARDHPIMRSSVTPDQLAR